MWAMERAFGRILSAFLLKPEPTITVALGDRRQRASRTRLMWPLVGKLHGKEVLILA